MNANRMILAIPPGFSTSVVRLDDEQDAFAGLELRRLLLVLEVDVFGGVVDGEETKPITKVIALHAVNRRARAGRHERARDIPRRELMVPEPSVWLAVLTPSVCRYRGH